MGNTAMTCFRGRSAGRVKVVLMNGEIAEFKGYVTASTVMRRYPQHVVLHCSLASPRGTGQRRKVAVMKPDQPLRVSQSYIVMPVHAAGSNSKNFLDSWAFFSLNSCTSFQSRVASCARKKAVAKAARGAQHSARWSMKQMFTRFFRAVRAMEDVSRPLLDPSERVLNSSTPEVQQTPARTSLDASKEWRPSLECIPESPLFSPHRSRNTSPDSRSSCRFDFPY